MFRRMAAAATVLGAFMIVATATMGAGSTRYYVALGDSLSQGTAAVLRHLS